MADPAAQRIAENLAAVQQAMARAAGNRLIRLISVTKYAPEQWVEALLDAGATELGESLLPAAAERFSRLQARGYRFTRHLIGAQQSRKVRDIPAACDLFQALDRDKTVDLLQATLAEHGQRLDVLLQVNIDAEQQKHGYLLNDAMPKALQLAEASPHLNLRGLMAIPRPRSTGETAPRFEAHTRRAYSTMAQLFAKIAASLPRTVQWDTLSMGMSQDYVWAIEEGATLVRVGSALFAGLEG